MLKQTILLPIKAFILIVISISPVLADQNQTAETPLQKRWTISAVGTHQDKHLGFIKFTDSMIEGQSTCNTYSAVYETKPNNQIKINRIATTTLICKLGNKMQIEEQYIDGLEQAQSYTLQDGVLTLFTKDKTEIARFK